MNVETEKLLQDYLDGRLTDAQCIEFESRLRCDETLSRQVAAARQVRSALRGETPELSPGFYTRARARFEEQARPQRRSWFRPLSWESAGLAVAAALVLVLVAPALLRNEIEIPGSATSPVLDRAGRLEAESVSTGKQDDADRQFVNEKDQALTSDRKETADKGFADAPGADRSGSLGADLDEGQAGASNERVDRLEAPVRQIGEKRVAAAGDRAKNEPPLAALSLPKEESAATTEQDPTAQPPVPAPAPVHAELKTRDVLTDDERQRSFDEYRARELTQSAESQARPKPKAQADPNGLGEVEEANEPAKKLEKRVALDAEFEKDSASDQVRSNFAAPMRGFQQGSHVGIGGAGVPAGVVAPGVLEVIESRERWDLLIAGPAGAAIGSLGARYGEQRVVLIGKREGGLDCSRIVTRSSDDGYMIELPGAPEPGATASEGCAILVPWDGKRVFLSDTEP